MLSNPLLRTKLYIPPLPPEVIPRPRLTERLNEGLKRKLTLIAAPAGFGKTTLMSELRTMLPDSDYALAWLALDEGDDDPTRFLAYMVAALQTIHPNIGEVTLALLQTQQAQLGPLEPVVSSLINDLDTASAPSDSGVDSVLVLDDYHLINSPDIHNAMAFLLDHLPPHIHLAILSRADPPLPLSRLRVRRQLVELREADLRFTLDEATTFLNQVMGLELSAAEVAALEARTEGWVAGLQLAALSMRGRDAKQVAGFIQTLSGSHHYIVDYLAEEVLRSQPEHIRDFLLQTSVLDRLNGSLCDAVLNRDPAEPQRDEEKAPSGALPPPATVVFSQEILAYLEQANLFLIPLDDDRRWYRYHQLFADFLHSHLQQTVPDQIATLHRRAASWYEAAGLEAEAVKHALAAEEFDRAARLIEQTTLASLKQGNFATLLHWLDALPDEVVQARPLLCLARAWSLTNNGQFDDAETLVQPLLTMVDEPEVLGQAATIRAAIELTRGNAVQAVELSRQALEHLPQPILLYRVVAAFMLGAAAWFSDQIEHIATADQAMTGMKTFSQRTGDIGTAFLAVAVQADLALRQEYLRQAELLYREALRFADQWTEKHGQQLPRAGMAYVGLGELLREWNDLDAATDYLNQGNALGEQSGDGRTILIGYTALAQVLQAQGDLQGALEQIERVEQLGRGTALGPLAQMASVLGPLNVVGAAIQVQVWLAQGKLDEAIEWADEQRLTVKDEPNHLRESEYMALARIHLAQNDPNPAATLLENLLQKADAAGRLHSILRILRLQALVFQAQGQIELALQTLKQALALAEPEGYVRLFVDEGSPMAALLLKLLESQRKQEDSTARPTPGYLRKLLAALGVGTMVPVEETVVETNQALVEPLTERELEVLDLIAAGLSNQDIADRLIIAPSTAKTHIKNIYGKLGVKSRIQAVAKAKELNLL